MIRFILVLSFCISNIFSFAQENNHQQLLNMAIKETLLYDNTLPAVVYIKPGKILRLSFSDTSAMNRNDFFLDNHYKLSAALIAELVENSHVTDTTLWSYNELKNVALISSKEDLIAFKDIKQNLHLTDKDTIKSYRKKINRYNNSSIGEKDVFQISRPVFDHSRQFAIVCLNDSHGGFGGGGCVTLFHFENDKWVRIGQLEGWQY